MVFPLPVGLPLTVSDNVAYAPRMAGEDDKEKLAETLIRRFFFGSVTCSSLTPSAPM